jgi:hypothetical protein
MQVMQVRNLGVDVSWARVPSAYDRKGRMLCDDLVLMCNKDAAPLLDVEEAGKRQHVNVTMLAIACTIGTLVPVLTCPSIFWRRLLYQHFKYFLRQIGRRSEKPNLVGRMQQRSAAALELKKQAASHQAVNRIVSRTLDIARKSTPEAGPPKLSGYVHRKFRALPAPSPYPAWHPMHDHADVKKLSDARTKNVSDERMTVIQKEYLTEMSTPPRFTTERKRDQELSQLAEWARCGRNNLELSINL